jgi:twinkle protein
MKMLLEHHAKLLSDRGLDVETLANLGVVSSKRLGGDCIAIPYVKGGVVVNHKYRTLGDRKEFGQDAGAVKCLWNRDVLTDDTLAHEPVIVTEGEFDAVAAMMAGFPRTVSVPDGAPKEAIGDGETRKYTYLDDADADLRDVREFILAVDGDGPGAALLHDLSHRLGRARCRWVEYPLARDRSRRLKDLNEVLVEYGIEGVQKTIRRAQYVRVSGVFRMSELPPVPEREPHRIGILGLEPHYNARLGDFTVCTGIPSMGKTAFVNDVCCNLVASHKWPVAFASFEQAPQVDHRRNLRTWHGRKLVRQMDRHEIEAADKWIDQWFSFIVPDEDEDADLGWALERCATAVLRYSAKVVVIDPWNEMDHVRPPDMSLTEYTGFAIKQFKKFAKKYGVHLIVVAHPSKQKKNDDGTFNIPSLYDISDSQHWFNKPDVGLVVHRENEDTTIVRIAKSRYHDTIGKPGDVRFRFIRDTNRFDCIEIDVRRTAV